MLEYSLKKQLSKSLPQCKQRVVTKARTLVQFWHPHVPTYLSLRWFILVFLSGDMWPCHNLLSKMCEDLYLGCQSIKNSLHLSSSVCFHSPEREYCVGRSLFISIVKQMLHLYGCIRWMVFWGFVVTQQKKFGVMAFKVKVGLPLRRLSMFSG